MRTDPSWMLTSLSFYRAPFIIDELYTVIEQNWIDTELTSVEKLDYFVSRLGVFNLFIKSW